MTPHDHREFVPGCFRCELGRDEVEDMVTVRLPREAWVVVVEAAASYDKRVPAEQGGRVNPLDVIRKAIG